MMQYLSQDVLVKFLKFGTVGATGVVVDFGFTWLSKEVFKVQKYVANVIGFTLAASSNYFLNRWWTFKSNNPELMVEYSRFLFFSLIGLGLNTLILWYLVSRRNHNFYVSKLFAIGIVTVWNFFINLMFTFVS
jgi:putative flippase GtrA